MTVTDAELKDLLRPHIRRIVEALCAGGEHPYADPPAVATFASAVPAQFTADDAPNFADYFADTDGLYPTHLHTFFSCSPRQFASHTGLVRKQITDKNGRRTWHWVRREQPPAAPQSKPKPADHPDPSKSAPGGEKPKDGAPAHELVPTKPSKLGRATTALADKLAKTKGGRAILAMGRVGLKVFHALEHRLLYAAKKTQQVAVEAARERGLDEDRTAKLKHALYCADFVGGYATGGAALAIAGPVAGKVAAIMPSASVVYLAYSTAVNPLATFRAARKVLKSTFGKGEAGVATHAAEDARPTLESIAGPLADALAETNDADWFVALYCAALAETDGDVEAACELARHAADEEHDPEEEETEEFAAGKAKAKPNKVWKEIEVKTKSGKTYKTRRLVNADQPAAGKTKGKAKPKAPTRSTKPAKPDPKATADEIRAQLAGDASKLTPKAVKEFDAKLAGLTKPQIVALAKEHALKVGKTKADAIAALVAKAKQLKKAADAEKKKAKAAPKEEPKQEPAPEPEPKPAEAPKEPPAAEQPKPAPKPAAVHATASKLVMALNGADDLTDDQREHYGRSLARVVRAMPAAALDRIGKNLDGATFHKSTRDIVPAMIEQLATQPGISDEQKEFIRKNWEHLKSKNVGGVYMNGFKHVHLDGDNAGGKATSGRHGATFNLTHGLYGHELTHAIDGPTYEVSKTPEWADAFKSEIEFDPDAAGFDAAPLTYYANSKPSEGLAEFGRLVYASDVPHAQIAAEFPKCTAVWKARGLWPETERTGPEAKLPEVFSERVEIGTDGSHADVLKDKPAASGWGSV